MHNFEHKKLIGGISALDALPANEDEYAKWISADEHLAFLRRNAFSNEIIVFASAEYTYIHSIVVPNSRLSPLDHEDLLHWGCNPYHSVASYVSGGGHEGVWIERGLSDTGTKTLEGATPLVFGRTFEGFESSGRNYFEVNQEYTHLTGIHWRPEKKAYCRFDRHGDIEAVVSITSRSGNNSPGSFVTFKWEPLQQYLAACDSTLVRLFDFTLLRREGFTAWPDSAEVRRSQDRDTVFYRQKIDQGRAGYSRGFQLVRIRKPALEIQKSIVDGWSHRADEPPVEFIAHDWRNRLIRKISTERAATTNYLEAKDNDLPFELSPAFFKPEVLLKYKADREKYTVDERDVSCRASWSLRGIDVNEAGQIHAYICDLRELPHAELLHWLSYNEAPKVGISERAVINDFEGQFVDFASPIREILTLLRGWVATGFSVWQLRDERLLELVSKPLSSSRDEWAESFMDLAKLVIEGFSVEKLRDELNAVGVQFEKEQRSLGLLQELLTYRTGGEVRLAGLREVQNLRSKVKGHVSGSVGDHLSESALAKFETYGNHFDHVCNSVLRDLQLIDKVISRPTSA